MFFWFLYLFSLACDENVNLGAVITLLPIFNKRRDVVLAGSSRVAVGMCFHYLSIFMHFYNYSYDAGDHRGKTVNGR